MDPRDRDIIARTIVGEAANQPFEGQQAVANVILNRLRSGKFGQSISDVVFAPYQFEPWQTRRAELEAIDPRSPAYARAAQAIDAAGASDLTNGATHFLEPTIVRQRRGGTLPNWAQGPSTSIGNHLFFNPGGNGRAGSPKATIATNATPYQSAPQPVPQTAEPGTSSLGSMLAMMAPDVATPEALTPLANTRQIGPFASEGVEEIDPAIFRPRRSRPKLSRA
jgi:hypothetical protein